MATTKLNGAAGETGEKDLKDIAIGDRVWVSAPYTGERGNLHTVKHLTPKVVSSRQKQRTRKS